MHILAQTLKILRFNTSEDCYMATLDLVY